MLEEISFIKNFFLLPLLLPDPYLALGYFILYIIGSIPFAYLLTKFFGFGDIRNIGSGNIGATNVLRTGNKFLAFVVLILDVAKGFVPIFFIKYFFLENSDFEIVSDFAFFNFLGLLIILGHIFPIWLKFKGGKGVATYIGVLFAVDLTIGFYFIVFWLIIAFIFKYSSLSSILSCLLIPVLYFYISGEDLLNTQIIFLMSLIIILKHYYNILRLLNNSENKIKF